MATTQLESALVVTTAPDFAEPVTRALEALREADPAFGDAFTTHFVSAGGSAEERAESFGAESRSLGPAGRGALAAACQEHWSDYRLRIAFMHRGFADGWFSHSPSGHDTVLVSMQERQRWSSLPGEAFVACELLLWCGGLLTDAYDSGRLLHAEPNRCLFDMCIDRRMLDIKLRMADVCPRCRSLLGDMGMPIPRIRRLLEAVRRLAVQPWRDQTKGAGEAS